MLNKFSQPLSIIFTLALLALAGLGGYVGTSAFVHMKNPLEENFKDVVAWPALDLSDVMELGFKDLQGRDILLRDMEHSLVVLNLWASWCAPCIKEIPTLQDLRDSVSAYGIGVYAVSVDRQRNAVGIEKFMKSNKLGPVAAYHDEDALVDHYLPYSVLPKTFIIDLKEGVLYQVTGEGDWNMPAIRGFLINLVKS